MSPSVHDETEEPRVIAPDALGTVVRTAPHVARELPRHRVHAAQPDDDHRAALREELPPLTD